MIKLIIQIQSIIDYFRPMFLTVLEYLIFLYFLFKLFLQVCVDIRLTISWNFLYLVRPVEGTCISLCRSLTIEELTSCKVRSVECRISWNGPQNNGSRKEIAAAHRMSSFDGQQSHLKSLYFSKNILKSMFFVALIYAQLVMGFGEILNYISVFSVYCVSILSGKPIR